LKTIMQAMTSQERLTAAINGRPVDHLPFSPFLAYIWESLPPSIQDKGQLAFNLEVGADPLWRGAPCPVKANVPGMEMRVIEGDHRIVTEFETPAGTLREEAVRSDRGNTNFLVGHPLKCAEDYKVALWIEEHTQFEVDLAPVQAHLAGDGRVGLSLGMLLPRGKSAFQTLVEHHVGTEELVYALADMPDTVESLWRAMVENDLRAARMAADTGVYDYFITWEDSGTQNYSPWQYDRYIGAEIGQWCGILAANGQRYIQHACGNVRDLVARMKATGVFAVESISPPPTGNVTIAAARQKVGSDFGIIGGIEPTDFLNLSLADLEPYVERVIEAGRGGPFILANSDSCPPGVTVEKFKLVSQIAKRHAC
jgi:hypothetical protein